MGRFKIKHKAIKPKPIKKVDSMRDASGRTLKAGQIVELPHTGMLRGQIVAVQESVITQPGRQPAPPHVIVQVHIPRMVQDALGTIPMLYVVEDVEAVEQAAQMAQAGQEQSRPSLVVPD